MYDKDRFSCTEPVFSTYTEDSLSQISLETIIGKILLDADFRDSLLATPDDALAHFNLTQREKDELKCLDCETMEFLANTLAIRLSQIRKISQGNSLNYYVD